MKTKTELKRLKTFKAKRISNAIYCIEDIDKWKADVIAGLKARLGENFDESELKFNDSYGSYGPYTFMAPKIQREVIGEITMKSKEYVFKFENIKGELVASHGQIKDMLMTDIGWDYETFNGTLSYEVLND